MLDDIRKQIDRIEDGEYHGENGDGLRHLDLHELRMLIDNLQDKLEEAKETLNSLV